MSNGKSAALVGALLGLGLGDLEPKLNGTNARRAAALQNANPIGDSSALGAFDTALSGNATANVAPQAPRRLPPVDDMGQSLDSAPVAENQGDIAFQALPSMGGDMVDPNAQHPDKYDTALGDTLQATRKARVYKAGMEAAYLGYKIGQPGVDRQQAASAIQQYHQKYPDINIPVQPFTSAQAKELRDRVLLEQHRDEAEAQGFPRNIYSGVDKEGNPVENPLVKERHFQDRQLGIQNRAEMRQDAAVKRQQDIEARNTETANRIAQQKAAQASLAEVGHHLDKIMPQKPQLTNIPSRDAAAQRAYETKVQDIANQRQAALKMYYQQMGVQMPEAGTPAPASPVGAMFTPNTSPVPAAPNPQQQRLPVLHIGTPEQRAQERGTFKPGSFYFDEKTGQTVSTPVASTGMLNDMINMRR